MRHISQHDKRYSITARWLLEPSIGRIGRLLLALVCLAAFLLVGCGKKPSVEYVSGFSPLKTQEIDRSEHVRMTLAVKHRKLAAGWRVMPYLVSPDKQKRIQRSGGLIDAGQAILEFDLTDVDTGSYNLVVTMEDADGIVQYEDSHPLKIVDKQAMAAAPEPPKPAMPSILDSKNFLTLTVDDTLYIDKTGERTIGGKTARNAQVTINGEPIEVGPDGDFEVTRLWETNTRIIIESVLGDACPTERKTIDLIDPNTLNKIVIDGPDTITVNQDSKEDILIRGFVPAEAELCVDGESRTKLNATEFEIRCPVVTAKAKKKVTLTSVIRSIPHTSKPKEVWFKFEKPNLDGLLAEADRFRDDKKYDDALQRYNQALVIIKQEEKSPYTDIDTRKRLRRAIWNQIVIRIDEKRLHDFRKTEELLDFADEVFNKGIYSTIYHALNLWCRIEESRSDPTERARKEREEDLRSVIEQLSEAWHQQARLSREVLPEVPTYKDDDYRHMILYYLVLARYQVYISAQIIIDAPEKERAKDDKRIACNNYLSFLDGSGKAQLKQRYSKQYAEITLLRDK